MTRFVIDVGVTLRIVEEEITPAAEHSLLAPTLLRSQLLDALYRRAAADALSEEAGLDLHRRFGKLKIRYLGDAVLRRRAWTLAARLGMVSTFDAEYLALTQLQADALVTENAELAAKAEGLVELRPLAAIIK